MPLFKSKSKKAFEHNVKEEMDSGHPQGQSLAIAFNIKRKNKKKKMYEGGVVSSKEAQETQEPGVPQRKSDDMRPSKEEYMADHFAYGGEAEDDGEPAMPQPKPDNYREPEDEYMSERMTNGEPPARKPDNKRPPMDEYMADHFSDGGSVADSIMRKRKMMANGGEVDLSENAEEEPNNEDQMSFEALKKENYSESAGLDELDQPMDSNEHGHELSDEDMHDKAEQMRSKVDYMQHDEPDAYSLVDSIRRRMNSKRGR